MKKLLLSILVLLSVLPLFSYSMDMFRNGEYAYYIDNRFSETYARGFLIIHTDESNSAIITNVKNLNTNELWNFFVFVTDDENGELVTVGISGLETLPADKKDEIFQSVPDFMNFFSMYKNHQNEITLENKAIDDPWSDEVTLHYYFNKELPFFHFSKITKNDDPTPVISLHSVGTITNKEIADLETYFYNLNIQPIETVERGADCKIKKAKSMSVNVNGYNIKLDENWQEDELEGNPSYWLKIDSIRDAQITIEKLPETLQNLETDDKEELIALLLRGLKNVIYDSVKVSKVKNNISLEYLSYDENMWVSYTKATLCDDVIINFSAFEEMYTKNKKYFDKILKSVSKK